jgi:hypothetical protein
MWECTCTATTFLRCAHDVALTATQFSAQTSRRTSAKPTVPALARAAPGCRRVSLARVCAAVCAMHVAANARQVPSWCCPTTARHLHASGGAARRTCQRTHVQRTLCIATAGVGGGVPDEGGGDGLWGKNSSDSPQAPPAAGRDPPRNVTGSVAADSRSVGARSAWGLSSEDKALPLSLLYPYERLPTGDKVRLS